MSNRLLLLLLSVGIVYRYLESTWTDLEIVVVLEPVEKLVLRGRRIDFVTIWTLAHSVVASSGSP